MPRQPIDLTSHLNQDVTRGHPADFPVILRPIHQAINDAFPEIPKRRAVVREDTGQVLALVSDRYALVPHQRILELVEDAITPLDCGPVPRGIYVDKQGARMRALFKFPTLAQPALGNDSLCPCLRIQNTYDGSSRIAIHIGAFRFVCTNLAVGGGGVFAGGFVAVHAGEVPITEVTKQLTGYLEGFEQIVELYRRWAVTDAAPETLERLLGTLPKRPGTALRQELASSPADTVWDAYNRATHYATHRMRSYRTAFDLLARINRGFQSEFADLQVPISLN
jgi:hypothetical protein